MIIIDNREKRSIVPKQLENMNVPIEFTKLEVGDYVIGNWVFERKEASDYASSLISGHLNNQLYNMSFNFEVSTIIIEGFMSEALMHRRLKKEVYLSSMAGTILKRSPDGKQGIINMVSTETPFDTAIFLKYFHDKCENYEPRLPEMERINFSKAQRMKYLVASFPNIGPRKAELLLEKFGSIQQLVNAEIEEMIKVKGIGKKIAKNIYDFVREYVTKS